MQDCKSLASFCRQAIVTRYVNPTDHKPGRIVARCDAKRITVEWEDALDIAENHASAALVLFQSLGWHTQCDLVMGGTWRSHGGYLFVQVPRAE